MRYFDHHAATPMSEAVHQAMHDARQWGWANASSVHAFGRRCNQAVRACRVALSECVGSELDDVIFTSGGTEACNLGVASVLSSSTRVIFSPGHHPAVAKAAHSFELASSQMSMEQALQCDVSLQKGDAVLMQWVNHETGTEFPVRDWAAKAKAAGAKLFVDATQAFGKVPVDSVGADAMAFAAHKMGGPAGAGALVVGDVPVPSRQLGGGQERGRRAGSSDVVALVGWTQAIAEVPKRLAAMDEVGRLRDMLEDELSAHSAITVNAGEFPRVATVSHMSVTGWRGDHLVAALDMEGICASSGPACSSGVPEESATVLALYPEQAWRSQNALRLSLGPQNTEEDIQACIKAVLSVLSRA